MTITIRPCTYARSLILMAALLCPAGVQAQPPRATVDVCLVPGEPCAERIVAAIDAARKEVTEFPPHPRHHGPHL